MNVLVTGATGFLGSHLCHRLAAEGHTITVLWRGTSKLDTLATLNLRYEIGEITDAESVDRAARGKDVVIHAAACLPRKGTSRQVLFNVNVVGTKNIVEACLRNNVRRLLHVSSVAAVGIPDDPTQPANEDFHFNLEHSELHYHISKHQAEAVVAEGLAQGLDAVIVNPTGLSGPAPSFYRGSEIVRHVRRNRILRYSPGGVCVAHVRDVIDSLIAALNRGITGNRYILGGENLTFLQMMERTAAVLGLKRIYVPIPAIATKLLATAAGSWSIVWQRGFSPAYVKYYCASRYSFYDSSKASSRLGFKPRCFEAIVEESLRSRSVDG
jgi:dihydroflavonol-4-reductase